MRRLSKSVCWLFLIGCGSSSEPPGIGAIADASGANACGGHGALVFQGRDAQPGDPCGACHDGLLICVTPTQLGCVGAKPASDCPDGAVEDGRADVVDAEVTRADAPDAQAADTQTRADAPDTGGGRADATDDRPTNACGGTGQVLYGSSPASPGDACGACRDGVLVCDSPTTLICSGAQLSDVCTIDAAAPNLCGGMGPLLWRGLPSMPNGRCGPCGSASLRCGSPTRLVCGGTADPIGCEAGPTDRCDIPVSAYSAAAMKTPALPNEARPTTTTTATISLAANALVYNPFDQRLYASVASSQGAGGNAIAIIDPASATIVKSVFVGSEPKRMALSDDGQVLWVALDGAGAVRQVDLLSGSAGMQFSLGADSTFALHYARDIAVLPGTHNSVLVTQYSKVSTATGGPILFDNGVPRAYGTTDFVPDITDIIPTYSPQLVFGYNNDSTGFELTTMCVNSGGIFITRSTQAFSGFNSSFSFAGNVIYSSTGTAFDIATGAILGTFAGRGSVVADPATRRVFFVTSFDQPVVSAYDMDTFLPAGSETLTTPSGAHASLVRWGRYGYAFRTDSKTIVIARTTLVPQVP